MADKRVRLLCVGNRFRYPDDFGIAVYERLRHTAPPWLEVVEGGVGGMSLSPYFEEGVPLVIADYGDPAMPKVATPEDIRDLTLDGYDHAGAFLYLLKTVQIPYRLYLCRTPYDDATLERAVDEIVTLAESMR